MVADGSSSEDRMLRPKWHRHPMHRFLGPRRRARGVTVFCYLGCNWLKIFFVACCLSPLLHAEPQREQLSQLTRVTASLAAKEVSSVGTFSRFASVGKVFTQQYKRSLLLAFFVLVLLVQSILIAGLLINRTRRKRSEEALRISEERYRELVESQTDLVCRYLPDTTITFANEAYCKFFSRSRQELLGRKFLELIPEPAREIVMGMVNALLDKRQVRTVEHEVVLPDGSIGWQQWIDYVIVDAEGKAVECQGIGRDITQRKRAEDALRVSEERMTLAAQAANLGFWVWHVLTDEVWLSDLECELIGFDLEKPRRYQGWLDCVHPEDRPHVQETVSRAVERVHDFENEYRVAGLRGETRWIVSRGQCLKNERGVVDRVLGVSMDITARKQAEEALQCLAHSARLALVGELAASISHEVNRPLSAMLLNADAGEILLQSEDPPLEEVKKIFADIRQDGTRANAVICRIRSLLRKGELQFSRLDLNEIALDVVQFIGADVRRRKVTLRTELAPELPSVFGDRIHLQQVLLNFLLNGMEAMEATPEAGRHLVVRTTLHQHDGVEAVVVDSGSGLPADFEARLFDSFFSTKQNGMGLGLAIARSIVEAHRGRIYARNNATGGATFGFTLPTSEGSLN